MADSFKAMLLHKIRFYPSENDSLSEYVTKSVSTVAECLLQTVHSGFGNSLLVLGGSASGKSMVIDLALKKVNLMSKQKFIVIRLNGLIHTDDKLALQEITSSLSLSEEHKSVLLQQMAVASSVELSFAKALNLVLDTLKCGDKFTQSVLVIIEEFDLFTQHHNQTLLYNLFDLTQSQYAPLVLVGVTNRLDVVGLLEKRVKSRFSHSQVVIFNQLLIGDYIALFRELLTVEGKEPFARKWNTSVQKSSTDPVVTGMLEDLYCQTKDVRTLKMFLVLVVTSCFSRGLQVLNLKYFQFAKGILGLDSKEAILKGLTVLEMMLVVAMKRLRDVSPDHPINFEMIYSEYKKFTQASNSVPFYKKAVVMKAFEHLQMMELVAPVDAGAIVTRQLKEYIHVYSTVTDEQLQGALTTHKACPTELVYWGTQTGIAT